MPLYGVDCSRHQGTVDWNLVKASGASFAIIKATDGTDYKYVGWYRQTIPRLKASGLIPGAYHWLRAGPNGEYRDPAGQARYFLSVIGDPTGMLCALDVELERNSSGQVISKPYVNSARIFAAEWDHLTRGHPLLIYTGEWYWNDTIGNPHGADLGPLWHSEYEKTQAEINDGPELDTYGGWPHCAMWQYTSDGSVPGVAGRVDLNLFHGSAADLLALAGASAPPPIPPLEDDMDAFLLYHPNDTFWLCLPPVPCAVQVTGDTYDKMKNAEGVNAFALDGASSDAIISRLNATPSATGDG